MCSLRNFFCRNPNSQRDGVRRNGFWRVIRSRVGGSPPGISTLIKRMLSHSMSLPYEDMPRRWLSNSEMTLTAAPQPGTLISHSKLPELWDTNFYFLISLPVWVLNKATIATHTDAEDLNLLVKAVTTFHLRFGSKEGWGQQPHHSVDQVSWSLTKKTLWNKLFWAPIENATLYLACTIPNNTVPHLHFTVVYAVHSDIF